MDRKELFKSIDSGQICPVYCFYGPEAYVRKQAERKLMEKLLTPGMEMMNLMVLTAPEVPEPRFASYGAVTYDERFNFGNANGFPASPFFTAKPNWRN